MGPEGLHACAYDDDTNNNNNNGGDGIAPQRQRQRHPTTEYVSLYIRRRARGMYHLFSFFFFFTFVAFPFAEYLFRTYIERGRGRGRACSGGGRRTGGALYPKLTHGWHILHSSTSTYIRVRADAVEGRNIVELFLSLLAVRMFEGLSPRRGM